MARSSWRRCSICNVTGWRPGVSATTTARGSSPAATASRWRTRASGATTTRDPATWLRHERSRSSPMATIPASKPCSRVKRSARTRMHPPGATKTSRTASCWPWSTSPSRMRSTTAPVLSQLIPTCKRMPGSSQLTNFGDTTPALERKDSSTSSWTASGASATSSWQSKKNAAPSTMPSASLEAAAYPGRPSRWRTKASGRMRPTRSVTAELSSPTESTSTESSP